MKDHTKSQNQIILKMLEEGKRVTPLTALKTAGTLRLSGRIMELRETYNIKTDMVTVGVRGGIKKRVASYTLA